MSCLPAICLRIAALLDSQFVADWEVASRSSDIQTQRNALVVAMIKAAERQSPSVLQGPSDKEKKYDRQLRLWAANGQEALENAHILLFNSGSGTVGVETLKNLVLPGIGKFTIIDDTIVNDADLGVNFFLDEGCLGRPRSKGCADFLQELNPDVKGTSISLEDVFQNGAQYTFIICTHPVDTKTLTFIDQYSKIQNVPVIFIHSAGFYSYFSVKLPGSLPIVDTHPDSTATTDLRLLSPWPELVSFALEMTAKIDELDAHTHGHIPYAVLLLHYLEEWKRDHAGKPPQTYSEKTAFRKMVANGARTNNPEGGEENYDEAVAAVLKTVTVPSMSSSVKEVFNYIPDETEAKTSFWIITEAVKKYHAQHSALPLPGSVPDMKAQSEVYVRLQNIYKAKARQDVAEVKKLLELHPRGGEINTSEIETYCKNAAFIKLIQSTGSSSEKLKSVIDDELNAEYEISPTLIPVYLALKASETASDLSEHAMLCEVSKMVENANEDERIVQAVQEVARARGGELHNISALTGGMVSQEVIKIITKQYIPIENTCIFDGIRSTVQILKI